MSHSLKGIDVARAAELMEAGALMVDVRESHEYAASRIPGSLNVALSQLEASELPREAGRAIVFFCASGGRTAMHFRRLAAKAGDTEAYVMSSGIVGWARAGLPVEQGSDGSEDPRRGLFQRLFG